MGIFARGNQDIFIGKVGNVVGSTWKDEQVIRAVPLRKKNRSFTQAQLEQHARFKLVIDNIQFLTPLFNVTFKKYTRDKTAFNVAFSETYNTITGTYPAYDIDWSKFVVSKGSLEDVPELSVTASGGVLTFDWMGDVDRDEIRTDKSFMVVYCPELKRFRYSLAGGERTLGMSSINVDLFRGKMVHTWFGFVSRNKDNASNSIYTGQVNVV